MVSRLSFSAFLRVLCTAIGQILLTPRRFSLLFLRDRVILRLEFSFSLSPLPAFPHGCIWLLLFNLPIFGFLSLSSASSVPLRFKGLGFAFWLRLRRAVFQRSWVCFWLRLRRAVFQRFWLVFWLWL